MISVYGSQGKSQWASKRNPKKHRNKKILLHHDTEVKPEQFIPFDDDEEFKVLDSIQSLLLKSTPNSYSFRLHFLDKKQSCADYKIQ